MVSSDFGMKEHKSLHGQCRISEVVSTETATYYKKIWKQKFEK